LLGTDHKSLRDLRYRDKSHRDLRLARGGAAR
jgi:hypothetical protein